MSYLVLARKWRPRKFAEMVGQQHVLRALINALDSERLHHAFLFTGTRGVGKTTVARIFAKSLNCEQGVGSEPCGVCSSCQEIDQGRFVDLIEVDAASRTGVDDTRDLLENVQYAPSRGRYKVYLIDEVHMFSKSSFNALLKTLEEPPPHVKFLLATTDPQRLPATILSRCLQFNLKRLSQEMIQGHLGYLLEQEGVEQEANALAELAHAADGSMRDALSLLDQAIAFGSGAVRSAEVYEMLGTIDRSRVVKLLQALLAGDGAALMAESAQLAELGPDYRLVLESLIDLLHRLAVAQVVGSEGLDDALTDLLDSVTPEEVQLHYQIALHARRDLPLVPDPRSGLEMALLRMLAFRPISSSLGATTMNAPVQHAAPPVAPAPTPSARVAAEPTTSRARPAAPGAEKSGPANSHSAQLRAMLGQRDTGTKGGSGRNARARSAPPSAGSTPPSDADEEPAPAGPRAPPEEQNNSSQLAFVDDPWEKLCDALALNGMVQQLAANACLHQQQGEQWVLALDPGCAHLLSDARKQSLGEALSEHQGSPVRLSIIRGEQGAATPEWRRRERARLRLEEAQRLIQADPVVNLLGQRFNARIQPDSVRPLEGLEIPGIGEKD